MRLRTTMLVLALGIGLSVNASAGPKESEQDRSTEQADADRRAYLRMQRNQRVLTQKEIEATIEPSVPAIMACYQAHASKQKDASGEMQLEMLIRPEGIVHRLWVRARGVKGPELNECVKKLADLWQFPKKPGFTNAIVPFYFQKTKAKGAGPLESCWNPKGCPKKQQKQQKKKKKGNKTK
jgi:hypothetical protein